MNKKLLINQLQRARIASRQLAQLSDDERAQLIAEIGVSIRNERQAILTANRADVVAAQDNVLQDRLFLDEKRLEDMAVTAERIAAYPGVTGKVLSRRTLASANDHQRKLYLQKITVPLGVVAMIYESRPNVTLDAIALALKAGNAVVLRGGSEAYRSNQAIVAAAHAALAKHGVGQAAITLLSTDRALVKALLTADGLVDIAIPRGSSAFIQMVRKVATVPVIETGAGVCHLYVGASADLDKAAAIILNAKLQRPGVCNALDTIVAHATVVDRLLAKIAGEFARHNVTVFADKASWQVLRELGYRHLEHAAAEDFGREYLGYGCSIKTVDYLDEALGHIRQFSSKHSETIVSRNRQECKRFIADVDAAVVLTNASSRLVDGEQFGLGAEMGISTQKLHARGPFGYEKLVCEKWVMTGDGHIRQ